MGWFLIGAGAFSAACAVGNWNWFMKSPRALLFVKLFGRNGARVFYTLLGLVLVGLGVAEVLGYLD